MINEQTHSVVVNALSIAKSKSLYEFWLVNYIIGNRHVSDQLLKVHSDVIRYKAMEFKLACAPKPNKPRMVYRGVLLHPDHFLSDMKLFDYPEVSFTDDLEVAKAFSSTNSIYSEAIPTNYVGHIIKLEYDPTKYFTWFDNQWNLPKYLQEFIDYWNQKELIIGKL